MPAQDYYRKRSIDEMLLTRSLSWLRSGKQSGWLSLLSTPGRGNTSLLRNFISDARRPENRYTLGEARILYVAGAQNGEPTSLSPVAQAVFDAEAAGWRHRVAKVWYRAKRSLLFILYGVILLAGLMLREPSTHLITEYAFWADLLNHLFSEPAKTAQTVFFGLLVDASIAGIVHLSEHRRSRAEKRDEATLDEQRAQVIDKYGKDFFASLSELCRGHKALFLVLDDADRLPNKDRDILEQLFSPLGEDPCLTEFADGHRIFLISLDMKGGEWTTGRERRNQIEPLAVPAFMDFELLDIYTNKYPDRTVLEFEKVRERARQDVVLLFDEPPRVKKVVEEFRGRLAHDRKTEDIFGFSDWMVFWAVREISSVERQEILTWLKEFTKGDSAVFGWQNSRSVESIITRAEKSALIRFSGLTLHFDLVAVRGLLKFVNEEYPTLTARAHFYWTTALSALALKKSAAPTPAGADGNKDLLFKKAAWHASRIGLILPNSAAQVMAEVTMSAAKKTDRCKQIAEALIKAAAIYRLEGDITESDDLLDDALDWISELHEPARGPLLGEVVAELWHNYWVTGGQDTRDKLEQISLQWSDVIDSAEWLINYRYEELVRCRPSLTALPSKLRTLTPHLRNVRRLTDCLDTIRRRHGFIVPGLEDLTIATPAPADSPDDWFESACWEVRCAAANHRGDEDVLENAITKWRTRLEQSQAMPSRIGRQAELLYSQARLWHLICEVWRIGIRKIGERGPGQLEAAKATLEERCIRFCPEPVPEAMAVQAFAFARAEEYYQRVLRLASILKWRALLMEVEFHFGVLLLQHTPTDHRTQDPPWWKTWEDLFSHCLSNGGRLGWTNHVPAIHRLRWEFFQYEDQPTSVDDIYRTFQATREANFPKRVMLDWHSRTIRYLTNYGNDSEDTKRCAELYELWAHQHAALAEAREFRHFKECLPYEQAHSMTFASQALRHEKDQSDLSAATRALEEAERLLAAGDNDPAAAKEPPKRVRDLKTAVQMERAWLVGSAPERQQEARQMIREIWQTVEPDGVHNANLLGNIVAAEAKWGWLDQPWPLEGHAIHRDPENPKLGLPERWFDPPEPLAIANRFEFRLRQLLFLVSDEKDPEIDALVRGVRVWAMWERFPETVLTFAKADMEGNYLSNSKDPLIHLLVAAALYFGGVDPDDKKELETLRHLIVYQPEVQQYKLIYIQVLRKHTNLLMRELKARHLDQTDWLALARRMDYFFEVLNDRNHLNAQHAKEVYRRGQSPEEFNKEQERRRHAVEEGHRRLQSREFSVGLGLVQPFLPPEKVGFVFLDELECLDLWLRLASHIEPRPANYGARAAQLRDYAQRYIGQFSLTVAEQEAQDLALELLGELQSDRAQAVAA